MDEGLSKAQASEAVTDDASALSSQTLLLIGQLELKEKRLSQMLQGAWFAAQNDRHPETATHAAHSARELMEKAPIWLPDVPVQQGTKRLTDDVRILHEAWKIIKNGSWPGDPVWEGAIDGALCSWLKQADAFFDDFAQSHQTRKEQIGEAIKALDRSRQQLPGNLIADKVRDWDKLREYFVAVAHHNKVADRGELQENLAKLEEFLLALIYPRPIPMMDEIDALISEGESQ